MKIAVQHTLDDLKLIQGIMSARYKLTGPRSLVLAAANTITTVLFLVAWLLVVSSWMFAVPDQKRAVQSACILVCLSCAFCFLAAYLRDRFTEHRLGQGSDAAPTFYELTVEGLLRTTSSTRTLFYWTPQFRLENDSQRYFLSFSEEILFVIPAQAFETHAEFEAFGTTANNLAHGA